MSNLPWLNVVNVRSKDDFPTAVGWFHELLAKTQYVLGNDVTITDKIKYANWTSIIWNWVFGSVLTYSGTWTMINSEDNRASISNITLDAPNWKVYDITENIVTTGTFLIENVQVLECEDYGTFDVSNTIINNSNCLNCKTSWIVMAWTWAILSIKEFFMSSATAWIKFLDLWSFVASTIEIQNMITVWLTGWSPAIWISWLASSWNVTTWNIASVESCEFLWNITPLENITVSDIRWGFNKNSANVPDTRTVAGMNIPSAQTVAIVGISTPVIVNDANTSWTDIWSLKTARKFEFSASLGRMTYKWEKPIYVNISATATVEKVWGGTDSICWYIAKNGTIVTDSKACTENSTPTSIPVQTGLDLVTDDFIEFAVENETTTADIIINLNNLEIF